MTFYNLIFSDSPYPHQRERRKKLPGKAALSRSFFATEALREWGNKRGRCEMSGCVFRSDSNERYGWRKISLDTLTWMCVCVFPKKSYTIERWFHRKYLNFTKWKGGRKNIWVTFFLVHWVKWQWTLTKRPMECGKFIPFHKPSPFSLLTNIYGGIFFFPHVSDFEKGENLSHKNSAWIVNCAGFNRKWGLFSQSHPASKNGLKNQPIKIIYSRQFQCWSQDILFCQRAKLFTCKKIHSANMGKITCQHGWAKAPVTVISPFKTAS